MSKLIEELEKDHSEILNALEKVRTLGIDSKEGLGELSGIREALLAHLNKEDKELYPALREAAEEDENLRRTLDMFAEGMEGISKFALQFFEKYSQGGSGLEFARDVGKLSAMIQTRIHREEDILFAEYEKSVFQML